MKDIDEVAKSFDFHGEALDTVFDTYAQLRAKCPVGHSENYGGFWFVTKSDDIFAAEQDPETFSVAPSMMFPSVTDRPLPPIDIDPPEHAAYRRILLPLFTPQELKKLEQPIRDTARAQAQEFLKKGSGADASYGYARPVPTIIFSRLAGYPEQDWPMFDQWVDDIIYERIEAPAKTDAANKAVYDYFGNLLDAWKDDPASANLIDYLCRAKIDGRPLSRDELLRYCYLLFLAGLDTTAWAIRAGLWHLANNPEDQQKLRDDPSLIPMACEEFLRCLSPVQATIAFQALVAEAARNQALLLARAPVSLLMLAGYAAIAPQLPQSGARLLEAHQHVLESLRQRDAESAVAWTRRHLADHRRGFEVAGLDMDAPIPAPKA